MDITIRRGRPADAMLLADLAASTFRETFAAENRPEDMALHVSTEYGVSQQEAELANPEITTLLAEVDGQLAGYARLRVWRMGLWSSRTGRLAGLSCSPRRPRACASRWAIWP